MSEEEKNHWETVYQTKNPDEVSWTQEIPKTSLDFIHSFRLNKKSSIIDIGGGDSKLADFLLEEGFEDITVLDISATALQKAKNRLGEKAKKVKWIISDITEFEPKQHYDVWHDRATFHFLTTPEQVKSYLTTARKAVSHYMTIGTFSDKGPEKCSGLTVKQYTEDQLQNLLSENFDKIRCVNEDHVTPFQTKQNFLFCSFKKHLN
ncbi:MAG: class I SAM-dependent methyltransferase [Mucilaginibacter sp.]